MNIFFKQLFPFSYYLNSRLNSFKLFAFHTYYEWMPAIIIFLINDFGYLASFKLFFLSYALFICVYEIGYIFNDYVAVKYEDNPRLRNQDTSVNNLILFGWITLRLAVFLIISLLFFEINRIFISFYILLVISFFLHNQLKNTDLKYLTFINLSIFRFTAPWIFFVSREKVMLYLIPVFFFYVLFRSLTYLESKNLLFMKTKKSKFFKIGFYILLLPINTFIFILTENNLYLISNIYYGVFWLLYRP